MAISKNFRMLMEDMRRTSPSNKSIDEDRDERVERREERRRERQEGKFSDPSVNATDRQYGVESSAAGKFKINQFIKALEGLKNQIIAKIVECDTRIKTDQTGTGVVAQKYKQKYLSFLDRTASILGEIYSRKEKEGRNLESDKDAIIIKAFRDNYNAIFSELEETSKTFNTDIDTKAAEYLKGLKFKDITAPLAEADKLFAEANAKMTELISMINAQNASSNSSSNNSSSNVNSQSISDTIKGGVKYTNDSKEGKIVIEIKKAIYDKFKKYKSLSGSSDWKVVYKSYPNVSGTLLANTQAVIKGVKAGLANDYPELKGDKTGDITPSFVAALAKVNESASNVPGKLISYEDFLRGPKLTEGFDEVAAGEAISGGSGDKSRGSNTTSEKPKVVIPEYTATPFATETESNKFRAWVNEKHADWAKTNNLSITGPKNNNYIKKAYSEFGEKYKQEEGAPKVVKQDVLTNAQMDQIKKKIEGYGAKAELKFTVADKQPCIMFYNGKQYGFFYNTRKVTYATTAGKTFAGVYDSKTNMVKFAKGKAWDLKYVAKFTISDSLSSESSETAQKKDVYVAKSGKGYVNVRSSTATSENANNIIIKFEDKSKKIGFVVSSTVVDSPKLGKKTWYKVQFPSPIQPNKSGSNKYEFGWVRSDTVDLK